MLPRITIAILAIVLVAGCQKKHREGVAIVVNGYDITDTQVKQAAEMLHQSMLAAYPEKVMEGIPAELTAGAAQQLIANRLLTEEAVHRGIEPSPAAVDSACQLLKNRYPDEAAFKRELTRMGETDSSFRSQIKEGVRLDSLMRVILGAIGTIDTQECRAFYEKNRNSYVGPGRVRASQIFLPFTDSMSADAKTKLTAVMQDLRQKLIGGADFASLAKKHSRGPGALEGGDIGWFKAGDLRADLEKPLFTLKKDELSDIVPTAAGLFLLKKTDEEPERQLPYDEVKDRVRMLLEIKARNEYIGRHIDSLISKAKITYYDTSLARGPSLSDMNMMPAAE